MVTDSSITNQSIIERDLCSMFSSTLSSLTNLQTLDLSYNEITDVSSLSGLTCEAIKDIDCDIRGLRVGLYVFAGDIQTKIDYIKSYRMNTITMHSE